MLSKKVPSEKEIKNLKNRSNCLDLRFKEILGELLEEIDKRKIEISENNRGENDA